MLDYRDHKGFWKNVGIDGGENLGFQHREEFSDEHSEEYQPAGV